MDNWCEEGHITTFNTILSFLLPLKLSVVGETTLSLLFNHLKWVVDKGFVKISATWSKERTCWTSNCLAISFSLTKYKSSSICFVHECNIRLANNKTVLKLSHHSKGGLDCCICNFDNKLYNRRISAVTLARLRYLASVEDREMICCFFEL